MPSNRSWLLGLSTQTSACLACLEVSNPKAETTGCLRNAEHEQSHRSVLGLTAAGLYGSVRIPFQPMRATHGFFSTHSVHSPLDGLDEVDGGPLYKLGEVDYHNQTNPTVFRRQTPPSLSTASSNRMHMESAGLECEVPVSRPIKNPHFPCRLLHFIQVLCLFWDRAAQLHSLLYLTYYHV
ncbi:hypothetical protein BX600DRAFT_458604 [Xylariales sp. PMI_506]|nr:hypothetical protein BX600DRAFT_458604 [Xylariales sp. PMI_506]